MSTYNNLTIQGIAYRLLRYTGITSFLPQPAGSELENVTKGDLWDVANSITAALQEIASEGPMEGRERPFGTYLNAPTQITLTATMGSTVISGTTGYQSWMQGCTIRLGGDAQDNELLSTTALARPSMVTGTVGATVYGDCITFDNTVGKIVNPVWLGNRWELVPVSNREDFIRMGLFPMVTFTSGYPSGAMIGYGLWPYYFQKPVNIPRAWFVDGAYDSTLGYTVRRMRVVPMPDQPYPLAYTVGINPPRITPDDIVSPLTTLTVTGATSDSGNANQTYTYLADLSGYRMFVGNTHTAYAIFFNPADSTYVLNNGIVATTLGAANHWVSANVTSPLGTFNPVNSSTGIVTVATSDSGGGAGDPGTVVPVQNAWVESILMPVALKHYSATPLFKNEQQRKEIESKYLSALAALRNSKGQESPTYASYV